MSRKAASGSSSGNTWDGAPEPMMAGTRSWGLPAGALVAYGLCLLAILTLVFTGFTRDDLETAYYAQGWRFHTHPDHPPLYAWLAQSLVSVLGPTTLATGILKVSLLLACYALIWLGVRRLTRSAGLATLAGLGLPATHFFGYLSVHNYTHTALLLAAMAGLFCAAAHVITARPGRRPPIPAAIGLGGAIGVGLLAKFSFAFFAPCLLAALPWATLGARRAARLLAIALAVAAPGAAIVLLWLLTLPAPLVPQLATAMGTHREVGMLERIFGVLGDAGLTPLGWLLPALLIPILAAPGPLWRGHKGPPPQPQETAATCRIWANRLAAYALCSIVIVSAVTLLGGGTRLREHYMAPVILFGPVYLALRLAAGGVTPGQIRRIIIGFAGIVVAYLVALPGVAVFVSPTHCERCLANLPVQEIGRQLADAGFDGGMMVSNRLDWIANLRQVFPDARLVTSGFTLTHPEPAAPGACLVITGTAQIGPQPAEVEAILADQLGTALPAGAAFQPLSAPLAYAEVREVGLSYLLVPEGLGACR